MSFTDLRLFFNYKNWLHKCEQNERTTSMVSVVHARALRVNPLAAKLFNLNFYPLEVVSR